MDNNPSTSAVVSNPRGKCIRSGQKIMVHNVFLRHVASNASKTESVRLTAQELGISRASIWKIIGEMKTKGKVSSPTKKRKRTQCHEKLDEAEKQILRKTVHSFFLKNEIPTLNKVTIVSIICALYIFYVYICMVA